MENQVHGQPEVATATGYAQQPERDFHPMNPNTASAAPEKKGIAEKVKELLGGHGHKTDEHPHQPGVYGDATPATGSAESTRVGCLDKIKAKTGVGHGLAPEQARAHGANPLGRKPAGISTSAPTDEPVVTTGHDMDPNSSPDFNGGTNVNASAAVHGGWPHPTNPNHNTTGARPTNPTGVTNAEGGATLPDRHGNVHEGPHDDSVKKEGFVSKIMDKLHSPRGGKPAHNNGHSAPTPY